MITMKKEMRLNVSRLASNSSSEKKIMGWSFLVASLSVALDQFTKIMVVNHFKTPGNFHVEVIPDFFNIVYVLNDGAAWNLLAGKTYALLAIAIVVFSVLAYFLRSFTEGWTERYFALFMIMSGIVGNSIDRIWNSGKVIDFLDFDLGFYRWPSFNVADSAICVGAILFLISSFIRPETEKEAESE